MTTTKTKNRKKIPVTCASCGGEFFAAITEVKRGKGKTCSLSCAASLAAANRDQVGSANNNWKGGEVTPYRLSKRLYRQRHPEKAKAHMMVRDAIEKGELFKCPCEVCGEKNGVHAHHDDYTKPLEVVWLCKKHHEERHVKLRSQGIGTYYKTTRGQPE